METVASQTRRHFITASLAAGSGLLLSLHLPARAATAGSAAFSPSAFVRIDASGQVTVTIPFVEMGQGSYNAVTVLIAEELEISPSEVRLEHAPADEARFAHPFYGMQLTGGSSTVRSAWVPMRKAGATARQMLTAAAAACWNVAPATCHARLGEVHHAASGRRLSYGALAARAAAMPVPQDVALKPRNAHRLIGRTQRRVDTPSKVDGSAVYGIDVQLPRMKVAAVAACPVFGGTLASVDEARALAVRGVIKVVRLTNAVAVIAEHYGAARKGLGALAIGWDEGPHASFSSAQWLRQLEAAGQQGGRVALSQGDRPQGRRIDAVYHAPLLAHATMEPMNCTARVTADMAEIWTGTQAPARAQQFVAQALGRAPATVLIHNHYIGGGFGRRLDVDYVVQAALIARQLDFPVKVIWSREEDLQHGMYRPYFRDELSAILDASGGLAGLMHRVIGSSVRARYAPAWLKDGLDTDAVAASEGQYQIGFQRVEYCAHEAPVPSGFWRGVGPTHNAFVVESFIDELAAAAQCDPLAYRLAMLGKQPRARAVLELAAQRAGWGRPVAPGSGLGIAVLSWWNSTAACVVHCSVTAAGEVAVQRVVFAVDCGLALDPGSVAAQIEGGAVFALSAALYSRLTVARGRIEQSNFHDHPVLRMADMPVFDIHLVASNEAPGGVGELGTALLAPALANAVFAASGKRTRTLPVA